MTGTGVTPPFKEALMLKSCRNKPTIPLLALGTTGINVTHATTTGNAYSVRILSSTAHHPSAASSSTGPPGDVGPQQAARKPRSW